MSTNYNRIKVADLETNESNKILTTDDSGKLEFTNINAIKVDSYNALDYTDAGKALDARQGKILKDFINDINALLISDNVNLNTIQKLVDAIEDVKASLDTILVNNLSSGGTTKALTAEMGKTLQNTKVDKAPGERLINAEEIAKLSGVSNVITTVKTIVSTALATQNVAGFVNYINALNPVLAVGPNEIVKYTTSDTGRTFELNLRGRSFGVGQPAITTSNVIEVTDFLNKDIKLSNYLSTRNDGQSPTNRVLGTDANGNLKMYSITAFPAPFLESLVADNTLPLNTGNVILKGAFFTPTMTVTITGQTVNYITFITDNEVHVNVTTGSAEGNFDVILNNGLTSTFIGKMLVVLGTIYTPSETDWINKSFIDVSEKGSAKVVTFNSQASATWPQEFDHTRNFSFRVSFKPSPLGEIPANAYLPVLRLVDATTGTIITSMGVLRGNGNNIHAYTIGWGSLAAVDYPGTNVGNVSTNPALLPDHYLEIRQYNGVLYTYFDNALKQTAPAVLTNKIKLVARPKLFDLCNIKYIELP
ncbi:hypothetical protein [Flavobacterium sp. 2]|uniref:hypothetical protein n=1 Tax=Flavobacterium sp. 2 TaxID=308053 RepID=UPI003CF2DE3B